MKRLFAIAVLLMANSAAHAGNNSYSFEVGGRTIHIDAPDDCDSPSCVSISIPGVYESAPKRAKRARIHPQADPQAKGDPQARVGRSCPYGQTEPSHQRARRRQRRQRQQQPAPSAPSPAACPCQRTSAGSCSAAGWIVTAPVSAPVQARSRPRSGSQHAAPGR